LTHSRISLGGALICGALTLWSCSNEDLGGAGSGGQRGGGTPGAGGSLEGAGGLAGAGGSGGAGGPGGAGGDGPGAFGGGGIGGGAGGGIAGMAGSRGPGGSGSGGFVGGTGGCFSIEFAPPVLNVFDTATGMPICDPTFTILGQADGGTISVDAHASECTPSPATCPVTYDGGATPCPFALEALNGNTTGFTVAVGAPGYKQTQVPDVAGNQRQCGTPYTPRFDVYLTPLPLDAGSTTDAHPDTR